MEQQATGPQQAMPPARPGRLKAWAQLFRLPNLLTVPGDPMAGLLLAAAATGWRGPWVCLAPAGLASLFIYCAGLVQNDLHDFMEDRRERPYRPLPSGAVSIAAAGAAFFVCLGLGVLSAALLGRATLDNNFTKRLPVVGALNMGLCRALSLLLGAAAVGFDGVLTPRVLVAAGGLMAYIASVSAIAAGETAGRRVGWLAYLPALAMVAWLAALLILLRTAAWPAGEQPGATHAAGILCSISAAAAVAWALACGSAATRAGPAGVQRAVGLFIQGLLPAQAAMASTAPWPGVLVAVGLLACWPISLAAGRKLYAS